MKLRREIVPVVLWLLVLLACAYVLTKTRFTADMSAFLPQRPTAEQALLVDQLKEGALSRTLLIGIEGSNAETRAALSHDLAQRLQADPAFSSVRNGGGETMARDRELLFTHRYLLSPAVDAERFSVDGLNAAIANSIDMLGSPAGMLLKQLLPRDPTGEMLELLRSVDGDSAPATQSGVWSSRDGKRAMLLAQTRGGGSDTDAQQTAINAVQNAFAAVRSKTPGADAQLLVSGAPVFAVQARATIKSEIRRISLISAIGVIVLLLYAYRSFSALLFGLVPVLSGALAGIAAVSLGFGSVHGITIGFGTTLIGEAVDYTIYYFVQSRSATDGRSWIERFWPTIRLGVLTSICGFASLLFSGFPGLAQLGLYSIAGLITAAAVTRFVLPPLIALAAPHQQVRQVGAGWLGNFAGRSLLRLGAWRGVAWLLAGLALAASIFLFSQRDQLWNHSLSGLSPISPAQEKLDQTLRADLGAPDLRYLVVASGNDREATLIKAEQAGAVLDALMAEQVIAGYESPARFLPSRATQEKRRAALPARAELARRLDLATRDLPLRPAKLAPFLDDVAAARARPLLDLPQLSGSSLGLLAESLLIERKDADKMRWSALLPLRAVAGGEIAPLRIQQALAAAHVDALCLDLAGESNRIYDAYLNEAILLSLAGFGAIAVVLLIALRSWRRMLRVLAPVALAVLFVISALVLAGEKLTLLHLIGMLLIVAVGSNYALFFDRGSRSGRDSAADTDTLASLLLASIATLIGFGTLALAKIPILHAIGVTVGPGAVLALLLSAALAAPRRAST